MTYTNSYNIINYIYSFNSHKYSTKLTFLIFAPIDISTRQNVSFTYTHKG